MLRSIRHLAWPVMMLIATSCSKPSDVKPLECRIQTHARKNTRPNITVTYELRTTGDHQVSQWFYYDSTGKVLIDNPTPPLMVTVTLGQNDSILTGAKGRVVTGSIRVSYKAVAADTLYEASDLCLQNLNTTPNVP